MFSSAIIFRLPSGFPALPDQLEEALRASPFIACGATQAESSGWIAPRGNQSDVLVEVVGGQIILKLQTETKSVPAAVVARHVDALVEKYRQETGRERASKKIKAEFKEEALQTLLPHAFAKQSATSIWIDQANCFLVVDAASLVGADKAISQLIEALSRIPGALSESFAKPLQTQVSAGSAMALWLIEGQAPYGFTVDRDCVLKASDDSKASVRYANHALDIDEVVAHVKAGKIPTQLALTWSGRASFVLGDLGQLGKITLLDVVLDDKDKSGKDDDGFDADVAILAGELSALIPDLIEALGGEIDLAAKAALVEETADIF